MNTLLALLKREILENSSIWKVPLIMLVIGLLIKVSMSFGSLSIDISTPDFMNLDSTVDSTVTKAVIAALVGINWLVVLVMLLVSIFYTLSCLYTERQDESILFWRSLPISDAMTIASKLIIALVLVPCLIVVCHLALSVILLGGESIEYLPNLIQSSVLTTFKITAWVLLPLVAWCLFCSGIAKKTPFLLAFVVPIIVISIDRLYIESGVSHLITDRFNISNHDSLVLLITGIVFSAVCVFIATIKRSQRI